MKKIALGMLMVCLVMASSSFAADNMGMRKGGYGTAGRGLGSMVFESNAKMMQVLAATTNGTFGSQTFGISSGTSNCSSDGVVLNEKQAEVFVSMNFETLNQEMASGKGENLVALANLVGCGAAADSFSKTAQANYAGALSQAGTPEALLNSVHQMVASDAQLVNVCR
jgi:hypothetical protein